MKNEILKLVREYSDEKLQPKKFIPGKTRIAASGPSLSSDDISEITEAVLNLWYTEGKYCAKFEREIGREMQKRWVTLCNSGSSASLLAMKSSIEVFGSKDYIITCGTNFPTTVAPIYQCGHIPIYIDIDPATLAPDMKQLEDALSMYKGKVAGAIFAHTLGYPFDEQGVFNLLGGDKFLIADCCDALGAELEGNVPVGFFADAGTLSFFPAHHITTAEGGAVFTNNDFISTKVESNANWGRDCYCAPGQENTCGKRFEYRWEKLPKGYDHKYIFTTLGYNLKMTEWQAAMGFSQIQRLSSFVEKRQKNERYLLNNLIIYGEWLKLGAYTGRAVNSPFGFPIMVNTDAFKARELIQHLEDNKVSTRRLFAGNITRQPGFQNMPKIALKLDGSDRVMRDCFWIGVHPSLTREMLNYVVEVFDAFFKEKGL